MQSRTRGFVGIVVMLAGSALLAFDVLAWVGHEMTEESYDARFFVSSAAVLVAGVALIAFGLWLKKQSHD